MTDDPVDETDQTIHLDPNEPLFSLPMDEGAGALIGAVAGDVAGGADERSYSAITQVSTVVAYRLLESGTIDREQLQAEILMMEGIPDGRPTFRGCTEDFRQWLDSAKTGTPTVSAAPSSEPAARTVPIGVWYRRDPEELVRAALASSRITHLDAATAIAAAAVAGAVAGSCFVQAGVDLVYGAAETA